jgi:hypothetical protein
MVTCRSGRRPLLALDDVDPVADELLREAGDAVGRLHLVDDDHHGVAVLLDGGGALQ